MSANKFRYIVLWIVFFLGTVPLARATHLRAGEITLTRLSCSSLEFRVTITVYTNTGSSVLFGDGILDFGDGSPTVTTPITPNTLRPDLGPNIGEVIYETIHTFPGPGQYTVSYFEHNRNAGTLNIFDSVDTPFSIQTSISIDPFLGCDNTPRLLVPPIDQACSGAAWYHNPGAYDPDGDSLSYQFTVPKQGLDNPVGGYEPPNSKPYYDIAGINYDEANETHNGPPTFTIDPVTGTIIWDAPGATGQYNIAFQVIEWRKINGVWIQLGYVTRDMQILVNDCQNRRPELQVPPDICVEAGTVIDQKVFGTDPDNDPVKLEAFSEVFSVNPSPATYTPSTPPIPYQPTGPGLQAELDFHWATECAHIKEQPYQVVFKVTDDPPPGKGAQLVQFKTWNITVVGPAPKWSNATVNKRQATLTWDKYVCSNAQTIQIWRRIDSNPYTPPVCVTGMPAFLGYTMINQVSAQDTSYLDTNGGKGLAPGAEYCYRLVAAFPLPQGGLSYVSQEICLPPIQADAPVITNVTVDSTSETKGVMTVKWRKPFGIDTTQYLPPFTYQVFRAEGFSGTLNRQPLYPTPKPDTVVVDKGLNTTEKEYNYQILAFDKNGSAFPDSSADASSVRLELKPLLQEIQLTWTAVVPWSNQTVQDPWHLIYRGAANSTGPDMTLIDSVNVSTGVFQYLDSGKYMNTPLKETDTYCYRVMTRGGYGNPKIAEPLINYSQINCAQPNDNTPPCKPSLTLHANDCAQYFQSASCSPTTFTNTLVWNGPPDDECRLDTRSYNIYVANQVGGQFTLYAQNVVDTFYVDSNLPSFARCYEISAVDRSGNESALSAPVCFDNCPHYELPNVFTPNGDHCNELFSAYSDRYAIDENGDDACGKVDIQMRRLKCARFVSQVNATIYNRWGKQVYSYSSGGERNIYIDWDGKDDAGVALPDGVYYYVADVTFITVDPNQASKTIKGWVQLIR
jgi:CHU_C Type IX secretion signal domain